MSELMPCPFQKEGETHIPRVVTAVGESWVLCSCGATGREFSNADGRGEERAIEFWNTRHERSCHVVYGFEPVCSECGEVVGEGQPYCSGCGAKVTP